MLCKDKNHTTYLEVGEEEGEIVSRDPANYNEDRYNKRGDLLGGDTQKSAFTYTDT